MRSFHLLVNPGAGGGAAPAAVVPVARLLREAGATVAVTYSPGPQATRALVAEAVGRDEVVVSVGGDGMVSSLAGPVAAAGGTLGMVPAGRGNDFARMLGLGSDPVEVARTLLGSAPRRVDLLEVTDPWSGGSRVVVGSVYAGVDARAAEIVGRARRVPRAAQYPLAAVRALAAYTPGRYRVVVDGEVSEHRAATVVVANSGYYGSGMHISPGSCVDDGLLEVVVVAAARRFDLIRSVPKLYDGSHVDLPSVSVFRGRRVELTDLGHGSGRVPVGGDGEPLGVLPRTGAALRVGVLPGALSLLAPGALPGR